MKLKTERILKYLLYIPCEGSGTFLITDFGNEVCIKCQHSLACCN